MNAVTTNLDRQSLPLPEPARLCSESAIVGMALQGNTPGGPRRGTAAGIPILLTMSRRRMRQQQHTVVVDGAGIRFVRRYEPEHAADDRTLVIVHGVGEHSGRYEHFVTRAVERGWTVIAGDLQGHGQSEGVPTHLDDFGQYLADLDAIWNHFVLPPERTALYGHSMGGLVSARFAETRPERIAALILSSPLLGFAIQVPALKRTFGRICLRVAPQFRFKSQIPETHITRNPDALQQRATDPLANRTVTAGWYFRVLDALCDVWQDADRVHAPLLILQGDGDRIVSTEAPLDWFTRAGSRDKSLRLLSEHLHELLNEPGWPGTIAGILDWLDRRVPAAQDAPVQAPADRRIPTRAAAAGGSTITAPSLRSPLPPQTASTPLPGVSSVWTTTTPASTFHPGRSPQTSDSMLTPSAAISLESSRRPPP